MSDVVDELATLVAPSLHADEVAALAARRLAATPATASAGDGAGRIAIAVTASVLPVLARTSDFSHARCAEVLAAAARTAGVDRETFVLAVGLLALDHPDLAAEPPQAALELETSLLMRLAPLEHASLWRCDRPGTPSLLVVQGAPIDADAAAAAQPGGDPEAVVELPLQARGDSLGMLVVGLRPGGDRWLAKELAARAAAVCGTVLDRMILLEANDAERRLREAAENRLVRLGFDLHDGAMQTIATLRTQLALLSDRIAGAPVADPEVHERLLSLAQALEEYSAAVDHELRDLVQSIHKPPTLARLLEELLEDEVAAFQSRAGISASLELVGDLKALPASQQHALLRIAQEALSNVERHSGASEVGVAVNADAGTVRAEIVDNGKGFEVEATLTTAARNGRMGLFGMMERARLLGGRVDVTSSPGGPTSICLRLPTTAAATD